MKKSFFLGLLCMLLVAPLAAEEYDLIITADRTRIPCTIVEISDVAIRYTRTDRPQTIIFSTPLNQIYAIVYRDGTIEQIQPQATSTHPETKQTTTTQGTARPEMVQEQDAARQGIESQEEAAERNKARTGATVAGSVSGGQDARGTQKRSNDEKRVAGRIYRDKNEYIYNDHYISEKEVGRVLQMDALAYDSWQRAHRLYTGGIVATSVGGGIMLVGLCCIPASVGAGLGVAGGGLVVSCVGVGLLCGSLGRYEHSIDIFNDHVDARLQVSFFASPSDVGFAMRF